MQARLRGNAAVASDTLRRGQKSRGTDLTNRVAAGRSPRRALRRLRPPEGFSILSKILPLEHLAVSMNARYKALPSFGSSAWADMMSGENGRNGAGRGVPPVGGSDGGEAPDDGCCGGYTPRQMNIQPTPNANSVTNGTMAMQERICPMEGLKKGRARRELLRGAKS